MGRGRAFVRSVCAGTGVTGEWQVVWGGREGTWQIKAGRLALSWEGGREILGGEN